MKHHASTLHHGGCNGTLSALRTDGLSARFGGRTLCLAAAALLCTLVTTSVLDTPAMAQESDDDEIGLPDVGDPVSEMSPSDLKRHDLYWADKRKVDAIQKRSFLKESRHEFTFHTGVVPNDEFYTYIAMGGRYTYFFAEDIGAEAWATYEQIIETGLRDNLETRSLNSLRVEVPQTVVFLAGLDVIWSPIHGKFTMFDSALAHFDTYLAFGAGFVLSTVQATTSDKEAAEYDMAGNIGLGTRIFLGDWISLRTDFRQYFYPAWVGGVAHPFEITLGLSFWTAAPE